MQWPVPQVQQARGEGTLPAGLSPGQGKLISPSLNFLIVADRHS